MNIIWKIGFCFGLATVVSAATADVNQVTLEAAKDTFGRSNERNMNNGASPQLVVARSQGITSLVSFDLSSVTNEIIEAEFTFRQHNTIERPINLMVAPMVHTANNASWVEGSGALGVKGRNAREGEATFAWRSFRDMPWETDNGEAKVGLMDKKLWLPPIAKLNHLQWVENERVQISIEDATLLETIRDSDAKIITFGLWGTAGNGTYLVSAKESGDGPKLVLTLKQKTQE